MKEATCLRSESKHFALGPIQYPTGDGFGSRADVTASNGEVRFVPLGVSSGLRVRFGSLADISWKLGDVRFTLKSGHGR